MSAAKKTKPSPPPASPPTHVRLPADIARRVVLAALASGMTTGQFVALTLSRSLDDGTAPTEPEGEEVACKECGALFLRPSVGQQKNKEFHSLECKVRWTNRETQRAYRARQKKRARR